MTTNHLAHETSPYLLQHQGNPVDWYPWNAAALARAQQEDKPIFLSIGYSACHWCHVMEHESFENQEIAALLNQHFVCIKVDREERPDLDQLYMQAVQAISGRGGWPLSAFLTPDLQPFFGGTYWPPTARGGMPGFDQILLAVADVWTNRRGAAVEQAARLTAHLRAQQFAPPADERITLELLDLAATRLAGSFDPQHGGFGDAPKFPRPMDLQVLLRSWHRQRDPHTLDMVRLTLDRMAAGGIYDHLGGGFARYSVDDRWLVPHFEKMLYDNALLAEVYLDGFLATGDRTYARVAQETLDYVLRDMQDPAGGFHSAEDADSEGEEGKFYVWSDTEIRAVLGGEWGDRFCRAYGVTAGGNFEGRNILHLPHGVSQCAALLDCTPHELEVELSQARARLLQARARRVRPAKDDKVLASWNALVIQALARGAAILERPDYLAAAQRAAQFLLTTLRRPDGRLLHCARHGQAKLDAYLDDYAYLIHALITLYETDFTEDWIDEAIRLADIVLRHFPDRAAGGFYYTSDDQETLIARTKEIFDGSVPGSNAMMAGALIRLGKLTGRPDWLEAAHGTLRFALPVMRTAPEAVAQMLVAVDLWLGPTWEIVIAGAPSEAATQRVLGGLHQTLIPRRVVACRGTTRSASHSPALDPLFAGKLAGAAAAAGPTVFVCEGFACQAPVCGADAILALWQTLAAGGGPEHGRQ